MTDGANYVALPLFKWLQPGGLFQTTDDGHFDPKSSMLNQIAPWGDTYATEDGKWFTVQVCRALLRATHTHRNILPIFYHKSMLHVLDLS
jgi:hypothetical protein